VWPRSPHATCASTSSLLSTIDRHRPASCRPRTASSSRPASGDGPRLLGHRDLRPPPSRRLLREPVPVYGARRSVNGPETRLLAKKSLSGPGRGQPSWSRDRTTYRHSRVRLAPQELLGRRLCLYPRPGGLQTSVSRPRHQRSGTRRRVARAFAETSTYRRRLAQPAEVRGAASHCCPGRLARNSTCYGSVTEGVVTVRVQCPLAVITVEPFGRLAVGGLRHVSIELHSQLRRSVPGAALHYPRMDPQLDHRGYGRVAQPVKGREGSRPALATAGVKVRSAKRRLRTPPRGPTNTRPSGSRATPGR
jgi:hypothetical protein